MEASETVVMNVDGLAGEVPLDGETEELELHEEVVLEGDGQLTLAIGGKSPTDSKVVLRGGQIPYHGQAKKGDHVRMEIHGAVSEVHLIDKRDSKTREIVETTRKHVVKIEGVRLLDPVEG